MNKKTVGIIGVGNVGSNLAFCLATSNLCKSILLKDIREEFTQAMALDISQAVFLFTSSLFKFEEQIKSFHKKDFKFRLKRGNPLFSSYPIILFKVAEGLITFEVNSSSNR